jgi:prepilin-type N-terminal cleavage/methylation domain-containing protein
MKNSQAGFTIIEMAIVMVLIGLIVGYGASLIGPLSIRAKRIESTATVDAAAQAVIGQATANQAVLPTLAQFPQIIKTRNDAWTRPIQYIYDAALADGNVTTGDVCTRRSTRITLRQCGDALCSAPVTVPNVAFVVLSGGENFNNQTSASLAVSTPTIINIYAVGADNVDGDTTDFNRPEPYDDIAQWATLNDLRSQVGCRGPQLVVLNNELPPGRVGNPYSAVIYTDGGVPFASGGKYLWCVETPTGAVPSNLAFRTHADTNNIGFTTAGASLAESSPTWIQSDHILMKGTPNAAGSFLLTVWGRDNSNPGSDAACGSGTNLDNCTHRSFVLTINP